MVKIQLKGRKMKDIFFYKEEKLKYVIQYLRLKSKDISTKLGISSSMLSQIQQYHSNKLKPLHLYAISKAYNIPMEIFENRLIDTPEKINAILDNSQKEETLFYKNEHLFEKLIGKWYLYSYPSNPNHTGVFETEHTIYSDASVEDEHKNRGKLYLGKHQSIIIKESHNSKNLTSITFDNSRVTYEYFIFSRVSKSVSLNQELFNFGFFSRERLPEERVKFILGTKEKVQLQIDYKMLERLSLEIKI